MRIELELQTDNFTVIPYNHQYYLASAIYNKIHSANPAYAKRLHNYQKFKFFTFLYCRLERGLLERKGLKL